MTAPGINLAEATVSIGGETAGLDRALSSAAAKMKAAGKKMQAAGRRLTTFVSLPLAAVAVASVKMASDAEESANKFNVVMGQAADRVRERLQELTKTIPLTASEMEGLAAGIQDLLVPMGIMRDSAASMSAQMVELAGDLGSFNNVSPDRVLDAMKSALAGASEPMRRFGVDTRVARLQVIALEEGLIKQGEELNQTAMAAAVLIAIQQDSTDAMGDAARTVDSTANSIKFLGRDFRQLAITIGDILIPVVTPMIKWLSEAIKKFQDLDPKLQKVIVGIAALAAALGPLLIAGGAMLAILPAIGGAIALWAAPIAVAVAAIGVLAFAGITLIQNWDVVKIQFVALWAAMKDAVFVSVQLMLFTLEKLAFFSPLLAAQFKKLRDEVDALAEESLINASISLTLLYQKLAEGVPTVATVQAAISAAALDIQKKVQSMTTALSQALGQIAGRGVEAFIDFGTGAGDAIKNFVIQAMKQLAALLARMLLVRFLTASLTGGVGGIFLQGLGGLAHGGPVSPGQPVIVGEQGPELLVPSSAGTVVPGGAMSVSLDLASLPPAPRALTPDAVAQDDWWRRAFSALVLDFGDRGGRFA